jgi:hypothetical protein
MFRKLTMAAAMAASALVAFVPSAASAQVYRDRHYHGRVYHHPDPYYYRDRHWIGRDRWEHRRWQEARRRHWEHERWERRHDWHR